MNAPFPHPADRRAAMLTLAPLHLAVVSLGAEAATALGMADAPGAARSDHRLWTSAPLVHEIAGNPLWQLGRPRPAATVATALSAACRLLDAALSELADGASDTPG